MTAAWTPLIIPHNIPANTWAADGDEVWVRYASDVDGVSGNTRGTYRRVLIDGSGVAMVSCTKSLPLNAEPTHEETGVIKEGLVARTDVRFIRTSSSTMRVIASFDMLKSGSIVVQRDIPSIDFTTVYDLYFEILQPLGNLNQIGLWTITMDLIKKF